MTLQPGVFSLKSKLKRSEVSINKQYDWCGKWGLSLNTDKTKTLNFGNLNIKYKIDNEEHESVNEIKFLGVTFGETTSSILKQIL